MPSNVKTAPNPATYASAWRIASQRDGRAPSAEPATAIAVSWPRYAGTSGRTHGERKLMTPAARATRIVRSVPDIARSSVQDVGQEAPELGGTRHELQALVAELDDRDRSEVRALPGRIGIDVAFDQARRQQARVGPLVEQGDQQAARLIAQATAGAAVQDKVGEGSVTHLAMDCRRGSQFGRFGGTGAVRWPPRPRSSVDRARPS